MAETRKIKRALVSVFHKDGLEEILRTLNAEGVELLSTGGTQAFIESLGIPCKKVEDVTTYPSILGGRVKTLHPRCSAASWAVARTKVTSSRCSSTTFRQSTLSSWTSIPSRTL